MGTVLVTGATGLVGGNVCRLLRAQGTEVVGFVRSVADAAPLADLGVQLRKGDITDIGSVQSAAKDADAIIHTAAVLGGTAQDLSEHHATNAVGSANVFDVAAVRKVRVVFFSTVVAFRSDVTLTERSDIGTSGNDPYTRTKRTALRDALARVEDGADLVTIVPGSVYGPSVLLGRALAPTSFNRLIRGALRGRLAAYPSVASLWVRAEDVAAVAVAALKSAAPGDRYLAIGAEDAIASLDFFNMACSLANVPHRVAPLAVDPSDPEVGRIYGESMAASFGKARPVPAADASWTRDRLSVQPADVVAGLTETVGWLRSHGQFG